MSNSSKSLIESLKIKIKNLVVFFIHGATNLNNFYAGVDFLKRDHWQDEARCCLMSR